MPANTARCTKIASCVVVAALGLALGAGCGGGQKVKTYEGEVAAVNVSGVAVGVLLGNDKSVGLSVGDGVRWLGLDKSWRDSGTPECLPPLSKGARVSIDTVEVDGDETVVRVRCESLPTEVYWAGEGGESPFAAYCAATASATRPISTGNQDPC